MWVSGFFFIVLFYFIFIFLDFGVDLVAQWEARGVDHKRDGGCMGCVRFVRKMTVLKK